jgi:hypothetical protein
MTRTNMLTLPEHQSSPLGFIEVPNTRSLVACVCFVDRCLSFYTFSFDLSLFRQILSHNVVHLALIEIRVHNISGDRH